MVTLNKYMDKANRSYIELYGRSTDQKPVGQFNDIAIGNASIFFEMDTSKVFMYDEENAQWLEI